MKAKELMIGDWVSVLAHFLETSTEGTATSGGYNLCRKNCRIGGMSGDLIAIDKICSDVIAYEPIPLTGEILKVNGWEKNDPNWPSTLRMSYKKDNHIFTLTSWMQKGKWDMYIHDGGDMQVNKFHPKYVHELQHAIRLFGLVEIADNFKVE